MKGIDELANIFAGLWIFLGVACVIGIGAAIRAALRWWNR